MNYLNLIILAEPNRISLLPTLMLLGTILGVGFLLFYFIKVDQNKDKQIEALNQKLEDMNNEVLKKSEN